MNFLHLLSSGASLLNFNLTNNGSSFASLFRLPLGLSGMANNSQEDKLQKCPEPQLSAQTSQKPSPIDKEIYSNKDKDGQHQVVTSSNMTSTLQDELVRQQTMLFSQYATLLQGTAVKTLTETQTKQKEQLKVNTAAAHRKKIAKINNVCGHDKLPHYAKGMCNNCYHRKGRTKKPWKCPHDKLYAGGMCQNCYTNDYNRQKRIKQRSKNPPSDEICDVEEQPAAN